MAIKLDIHIPEGKAPVSTHITCDTCFRAESTDEIIAQARAGEPLNTAWKIRKRRPQPALTNEEALRLAETHFAEKGQDHKVNIWTF